MIRDKFYVWVLATVIAVVAICTGLTLVYHEKHDEHQDSVEQPVGLLAVVEQDDYIYVGAKKDARISTTENYYATYLWTYEDHETTYEKQMVCDGGYLRFSMQDGSILLYNCIDSDGTTGAQFPDRLTIERIMDDGLVRYCYCSREWTFDSTHCGGSILIFHQLSPSLYVLRGLVLVTDDWSVCYRLSINHVQL